jgi:hypothetical protein
MFGFVMASSEELSKEEKQRYGEVYCGICRQIGKRHGSLSRLGLSFDLAFLALLFMSLYEPEETKGNRACGFHPVKPRPWTDNKYIAYCADMNVALAYYKAKDDSADEKRVGGMLQQGIFGKKLEEIKNSWPRQCAAIENCLQELDVLEKELGELGIGNWTKPYGGYFISFDAMEGCAKAIVAKCKEAGVVLTGAGATYPYGKDPKDSNIRIAPSFPTPEEMAMATNLFVLCVKLVSVEKLLNQ